MWKMFVATMSIILALALFIVLLQIMEAFVKKQMSDDEEKTNE